ncbi:MAG: hypothetical protein QOD88_4852, partial [Mycobacterium sp.]|nr:hypothetical protein [Mycobacterium sp.]
AVLDRCDLLYGNAVQREQEGRGEVRPQRVTIDVGTLQRIPRRIAGLRAAVDRRISRGARPIAALFSVLTRTFVDPAFRGCAFLNAGLEMHADDHPVRPVTRSHTDARRDLVADLVRAEGIDDDLIADAIALLVEGAFAAGAARRDTTVVKRAAHAAERVLSLARAKS